MPYEMLPIQKQVWEEKYRFIAPAGIPRLQDDDSIEDTWRRVAHALAKAETHEPRLWEKRFYSALEGFGFVTAGRIIAGAGTGRDVTLFNCFVIGIVEDSMDGIFRRLHESALTQQQGGGIGIDFSTLRPKGAEVRGVGSKASGPVSFMDVWDAMCRTIMSAGARRGAMMGTLRCDHPDIEEFIDAKRDPLRLRNFNVSVLVTDAFMEAVKACEPWDLKFGGKVYKTVNAHSLWLKIMKSAWAYAEPGVIFIDRINETNNLAYCETIYATNPCAEQPLPPNGACLLGSINLAAFIREPFTGGVYFDEQKVISTTKIAVRMLDNVIDISNYPIPEQRAEALAKRRIGLGVTGLGDALAMCGLHYGSPEACKTAARWMATITEVAYRESIGLAMDKGKFPAFKEEMGQRYFDRAGAALRNGTLTSIAPTGTISLLMGNVSSGIEPIYEWEYERQIRQPDGSFKSVLVQDYAVHLFKQKFGDSESLPPQFYARAHDLSPKQHLAMQAALQPHVDASISKTVNCPEDIQFEKFEQLYMNAYDQGLKVCAAFRENAVTGSILKSAPKAPPPGPEVIHEPRIDASARIEDTESGLKAWAGSGAAEELIATVEKASGVKVHRMSEAPTPRNSVMEGKTHKIKWNGAAVYVTINNNPDGTPHEIFVNSKHVEHYAWSVALTRLITAIWRRGGDTRFIAEELKGIADPRGGCWMDGQYVASVQAAIGRVIEEHLSDAKIDYSDIPEAGEDWFRRAKLKRPENPIAGMKGEPVLPPGRAELMAAALFHFCPKCGGTNTWFPKPNCLACRDCNFSSCD